MSSNTNKNYYILSQAFKKQAEKNKATSVNEINSVIVDSVVCTYCITTIIRTPEDSAFIYDNYEEAALRLSEVKKYLWERTVTVYANGTSENNKKLLVIYGGGASAEEVYQEVVNSESYKNAVASADSA